MYFLHYHKVFFSRITLEDKLGVAYEPYIFAALHSAKVMVVLGTRPEYFNAVWVKNEWSRYLSLIKNGAKKTLIPAYRDMNPYDLPEEFSHLQAQDMSKLGFMQDLTRGIKKIVEADAPKATIKETIVTTASAISIAPLLKRAFMFLEDGEFDRADEFCEQVLNQDPENAEAYLGKLMVELRVRRQANLVNCAEPFDNNRNYQKALRFANAELSAELKGYVATIKDRNAKRAEEQRKENLYLKAMDDFKSYDIARLQNAMKVFSSLSGYRDSQERIRMCQDKIDQILIKEENDRRERERLAEEKRIAEEKAARELQRQKEIKRIEAEKRAKRNKKIAAIVLPIIAVFVIFIVVLNSVIIPNNKYNSALQYFENGEYLEAYKIFQELGDYKESNSKKKEIADISPTIPFKLCSVGDVVEFGYYEQDGNSSNGKEEIQWRVLKVENNKVLVISDVCLASKKIHPEDVSVTWETSSIREWLNGEFLGTFTDKEKEIIVNSYVKNSTYVGNSSSGNDTYDRIFLLSVDEARSYFSSNQDRVASFSAQASAGNSYLYWWLRTKGTGYLASTFVKDNGEINTKGVAYWGYTYGIRPAMWIDISGEPIDVNSEYNRAVSLMNNGQYLEAIAVFQSIEAYKNCDDKINECNYQYAIGLLSSGNLDTAYDIFSKLSNYKDSSTKADEILISKVKASLKNIKVGDYIKFGKYEQDNNTSNGQEDIDWLVLEVKNGKALLISKYVLDSKQYNSSCVNVTWETCSLRQWLNDSFLTTAFSTTEKAMIPTITVSAHPNPDYSTNAGNATQDKVFVLSAVEAAKYFSTDKARTCTATKYAKAQGAPDTQNGNSGWKLRTPGDSQSDVARVLTDGRIDYAGYYVDNTYGTVRPAIWIDISDNTDKEVQYLSAVSLMQAGKYTDAILAFELLGDYKDSLQKITECNYQLSTQGEWVNVTIAELRNNPSKYTGLNVKITAFISTYEHCTPTYAENYYDGFLVNLESLVDANYADKTYSIVYSHWKDVLKNTSSYVGFRILDSKFTDELVVGSTVTMYGTFTYNPSLDEGSRYITDPHKFDLLVEKYDIVPENSGDVVYVSTAKELLENIGSNKTIVLTASSYNLSNVTSFSNSFVRKSEYTTGYEIINVENMIITGEASIVINDRYADVLLFDNCKNIELIGLTVGHTQINSTYKCDGSVVRLQDCNNVTITSCNLFGCGAVGLNVWDSTNILLRDSDIYDCNYAGISAGRSQLSVENCEFYDLVLDNNGGLIYSSSSNISFSNCSFTNAKAAILINISDYLLDGDSILIFDSCVMSNNTYSQFTNDQSCLEFNSCTIE